MTRDRFLKCLNRELRQIKKEERKQYISDYEELIADMMDSGISEEDAVAKQGDYKVVAAEILRSVDDTKRIKRDVPGLILHIITIMLLVLSIACIVLFPGIATVGFVNGDGASAVFFAGKMTEPIILYIVTLILALVNIVYQVLHKKKGYMITVIALVCVIAVVFAFRKPIRNAIFGTTAEKDEIQDDKQETQTEIQDKTKRILDYLYQGEYDLLREQYTAKQMQPYMTKENMEAAKSTIGDDWGELGAYGKMYVEEVVQNGVEYTVVQVSVSYENVSVFYTITFDEEGLLAGLYMK